MEPIIKHFSEHLQDITDPEVKHQLNFREALTVSCREGKIKVNTYDDDDNLLGDFITLIAGEKWYFNFGLRKYNPKIGVEALEDDSEFYILVENV